MNPPEAVKLYWCERCKNVVGRLTRHIGIDHVHHHCPICGLRIPDPEPHTYVLAEQTA